MAGKTTGGAQPAVTSAQSRRAPGQHENAAGQRVLSSVPNEQLLSERESAWPLPPPVDLASAEVLVSEGLENYYTTLGAWHYLATKLQQEAEDDCQRLAISALYCESFDPEERYYPESAIRAALEQHGFDRQQQDQALRRLVEKQAVKARKFDNQYQLALDLPEHGQLQPPGTLSSGIRLELLWDYGIENTYRALGQTAARWQQAQEALSDPLDQALLTRLYSTVLPAGEGSMGVSVEQLTLSSELSPAELQDLEQRLDRLVQLGWLQKTGHPPRYAQPELIGLNSVSAEEQNDPDYPEVELFDDIAKNGLDHLWRFRGRLAQARDRHLAAAENDAERALIDNLAELQSEDPCSGGFSASGLAQRISSDLGVDQAAEFEQQIVSGQLGKRLYRSQLSGRNPKPFLALVDDRDQRLTSRPPLPPLPKDRCAQLVLERGIEGYYQLLGRCSEIDQRLDNQLDALPTISSQQAQWLRELFAPGLVDPEQRWQSQSALARIFSQNQQFGTISKQLVAAGVLIERRPSNQSGSTEYALAESPLTAPDA